MTEKSVLWRLIRLTKEHFVGYILGVLGFALVIMAMQIGLSEVLRDVFNAVAASDRALLVRGIQKMAFVLVCVTIPLPLFTYIYNCKAAEMTGVIRKKVYGHMQKLPIAYYKEQHSADMISRLTNDINVLENSYSQIVVNLLSHTISGGGIIIYLFYLEWRLAVVCITIGVMGLLINTLFAKKLRRLGQTIQGHLAAVTTKLSDVLSGIHVIRTYSLNKQVLARFDKQNDNVLIASIKRVKTSSMLAAFNTLMWFISFAGLLSFGAYLSFRGLIAVGVAVAAVNAQDTVTGLFRTLAESITELQGSLAGADRIFEVLDSSLEPKMYEGVAADGRRTHTPYLGFANVSFSYRNGDEVGDALTLNDLSFTLEKGQVGALVGPSGGGKSTIVKILLGFYPPRTGQVYINARALNGTELCKLRECIAFVPQDAYLFTGTVAENIGHGRRDATHEEIVAAAKVANAHEFIMQLDQGYDTKVGERGSQISGGQRQRLAIARAVLKDAPILLLDEATSSLDTESEQLVQDALNNLMQGRTTLVIAHRLVTVQNADVIMAIDDGRLVEQGTHEELLQRQGLYSQLYHKQFERSNGCCEQRVELEATV